MMLDLREHHRPDDAYRPKESVGPLADAFDGVAYDDLFKFLVAPGFEELTSESYAEDPWVGFKRLVFHVFAALAEFERDLVKERTNAGLAAARARGRTGGRPSALSADQVKTARRLYSQQDMTVAQIGDVLGVSRTTVYRTLNRHPAPTLARRRPRPATTT